MMRNLTVEERLIVALDFIPENNSEWDRKRIISFVKALRNTGVYIKVNSALRAYGYELIYDIHEQGLKVFADLKLIDIKNTLENDALFLQYYQPELLTVMCVAGHEAIKPLVQLLPKTEILGVTTLTSLKNEDTSRMFGCYVEESVLRFAQEGVKAEIGGFISAPTEASMLRRMIGHNFTYNTPNIRPNWSIVQGDDQNSNRSMTPAKAIQAGADRVVIGRPITMASSPREAVMRTLTEIASATVTT